MWIARARGFQLLLGFVWVFIAGMDIFVGTKHAYFSVPFCLLVWGLIYWGARDAETNSDSDL